jgi:hypothetical protein
MAEINRPTSQASFLEEPKKLPDMINVLTILTFIGNGLAIIFLIIGIARAKSTYDQVIANQDKMAQMPSWVQTLQGPDAVAVATKNYENRVPITLLTFIGCALCIYGAIEMRRLKKNGFYIYLIGDIVPLIAAYIFIGAFYFAGIRLFFSVFFIILFLLLYATQLKHMKN